MNAKPKTAPQKKADTKTNSSEKVNSESQNPEQNFMIQKIFASDMSWESPQTPEAFKQEWKPEANIELNTTSDQLSDEGVYMVNLIVTVTVKNSDKVAFLAEVKQSGIFTIQGMPAEQLGHVLGAYCPTVLFPYARSLISTLVSNGGFPELALAPVNFDALYFQSQEQKKAQNN